MSRRMQSARATVTKNSQCPSAGEVARGAFACRVHGADVEEILREKSGDGNLTGYSFAHATSSGQPVNRRQPAASNPSRITGLRHLINRRAECRGDAAAWCKGELRNWEWAEVRREKRNRTTPAQFGYPRHGGVIRRIPFGRDVQFSRAIYPGYAATLAMDGARPSLPQRASAIGGGADDPDDSGESEGVGLGYGSSICGGRRT